MTKTGVVALSKLDFAFRFPDAIIALSRASFAGRNVVLGAIETAENVLPALVFLARDGATSVLVFDGAGWRTPAS